MRRSASAVTVSSCRVPTMPGTDSRAPSARAAAATAATTGSGTGRPVNGRRLVCRRAMT